MEAPDLFMRKPPVLLILFHSHFILLTTRQPLRLFDKQRSNRYDGFGPIFNSSEWALGNPSSSIHNMYEEDI
jgi:hypothetical protein